MSDKKIKAVEDIAKIVEYLKGPDRQVALCNGCWDPLHTGHILHLQHAKTLVEPSGMLVVTVTSDIYVGRQKGLTRPLHKETVRAHTLAALECVDYIAINRHADVVAAIRAIQPDLYVKGGEYTGSETPGLAREREAAEATGGRVVFTGTPAMSASALINMAFADKVYTPVADAFLQEFRLKYSFEEVTEKLDALKRLKVLVVGESIIDIYTLVSVMDKAPKTTILATEFSGDSEQFMPGGALHVALTLAQICDDVTLLTCMGTKAIPGVHAAEFIKDQLCGKVELLLWLLEDRYPTIKQRFLDVGFKEQLHRQTLSEICYGVSGKPFEDKIRCQIIDYIERNAPHYDLVVVADFGHGLVDRELAAILPARSKFLAVMCQANESNYGFNTMRKYKEADYICIDETELSLAVGYRHHDIASQMDELSGIVKCDLMAITRGGEGCIVHSDRKGTISVPVLSGKNPIDRVGAGDVFLSFTSPCAVLGYDKELIGLVGNCAGALACAMLGNESVVQKSQLLGFLKSLLKEG